MLPAKTGIDNMIAVITILDRIIGSTMKGTAQ